MELKVSGLWLTVEVLELQVQGLGSGSGFWVGSFTLRVEQWPNQIS